MILHGGPGGAINPTMRRFFDPSRWRMALFDQRGCGKSRPNASLEDNTTWALIEDIERLREHLGVEKWARVRRLLGLDPGPGLRHHPSRTGRRPWSCAASSWSPQRELRWFYQDGASMLFPDAWARFLEPIPEAERGDLMAAYHRRLTHPDRRIQARAAAAWSQWEGDTISIRGPEARPAKFNEVDFAVAFARIECHYFVNRGFFTEDNWILNNINKIQNIPGWIVQGRFDVVTPLESAWKLKTAWPRAHFEVVWDAGHASTEPGIVDGLVRATDKALAL